MCRYSKDSLTDKTRLVQVSGETMANLISSCMYSPNPILYNFLANDYFTRIETIVPLTSRFNTKVTDFDTVTYYSENNLEAMVTDPDPTPSTSVEDLQYANILLSECNSDNEVQFKEGDCSKSPVSSSTDAINYRNE